MTTGALLPLFNSGDELVPGVVGRGDSSGGVCTCTSLGASGVVVVVFGGEVGVVEEGSPFQYFTFGS